ncbi:Cysteine proteinase 1, mitochondrial [Nakaseomyces bracarensis]|uniref:Cysteine proteinase 1, mitochondrial n=1 Tax=Nakaseomyces bracarensis TaxID=273131 RepID=A0ABR4NYB0_9SACH
MFLVKRTVSKLPLLYRMSSSIAVSEIASWDQEFSKDLHHQLATTVLKNYNADDVLLNKTRLQEQDVRVFNTKLSIDASPVTNQKASGRCWLFAATNHLRINVVKELNLKDFELSQSYLFFYDKLEKANYFLEQIVQSRDEDVDSRLVQYLLTDPTGDGGQYSMFLNIVQKYGLLPKDLYNDGAYSTTASRKWNSILTSKLREFAETLREKAKAVKSIEDQEFVELRKSMQKEIFRLMTLFMDLPPVRPDEKFTWTYQDKDKNVKTIETTPLEFATKYCKVDFKKPVSLINDPRHPYGELIKIDKLGNVIGGEETLYLNVDNETLSSLIVKRLQNDKPVFFGSHTPKFMDKKNGVMDVDLWNYHAIKYDLPQSKASRIRYHESLMTHAMLITAVHVDDAGKPVRYQVENSWGKDSGKDGLYVMTQEYFEEYCYQIVVDIDELPEHLSKKFHEKTNPIVLPIWDPMGALAN